MIIQTITSETMFIEAFRDMDRMENFSIDGLKALYEFLEDMSQDLGEDYELDVVALCCDFNEMDWGEVKEQYGDLISQDEWEDCEDIQDEINTMLAMLNEETMVVMYDDEKVLFQVF